ncbi:DUF1330 domain-containing protein [uncultured Shimia sp.]|uniref:DUF1330 domain-containing protein n=1 Tax=uncultured Shimia sp. TaxID=573152 RepID=UPI002603375C|nr:DUF1330 domain-containing protein [uncultured Shimia sp.]
MAKGYWIGRIDVQDIDQYMKYVAANGVAFQKFGGRFLTRGGNFEAVEGDARSRNVVIEFPSYEVAVECYHSPEYQEARALRINVSEGELVIVEGYDG